jgi:Ser/Thr protein kinase RdoA (MazF antagonist)
MGYKNWRWIMATDAIENRILECLADSYGERGSLIRLSGENLNYVLRTEEGKRYVVKIVDDDMPSEVVEMEFEAIEYAISVGFSVKLPKIIQNKYRKKETRIIIHINSDNRLKII